MPIQQFSVSNIDDDGRICTTPTTTRPPAQFCPSTTVVNHAFFCMDNVGRSITPAIVNFSAGSSRSTREAGSTSNVSPAVATNTSAPLPNRYTLPQHHPVSGLTNTSRTRYTSAQLPFVDCAASHLPVTSSSCNNRHPHFTNAPSEYMRPSATHSNAPACDAAYTLLSSSISASTNTTRNRYTSRRPRHFTHTTSDRRHHCNTISAATNCYNTQGDTGGCNLNASNHPSERLPNPHYMDVGDCDQQCGYCGSLFWYSERLKSRTYQRQPEYHLCCAGGQIYMEPTPTPPPLIQQLVTNSHFMEHIRAYNQMFAMTSFGAKVDATVNRGRGPYVFKVSGQIYHWIGSLCPDEGLR